MSGSASQDHSATGPAWFAAMSLAGHTLCLCAMQSFSTDAGEIVVLRVAGEVDLATIAELEASLVSCIERQPAHLVVDLARLWFCSAQGMGVLFNARIVAAERGFGYAISGISPHVDSIWKKLWPEELPIRYHNEATAVGNVAHDTSIPAGGV